jgi:hypothetical protein
MPLSKPAPQPYGLDPDHFAVVDDELRRAEAYFTRLRDGIRAVAAPGTQQGWTDQRIERRRWLLAPP